MQDAVSRETGRHHSYLNTMKGIFLKLRAMETIPPPKALTTTVRLHLYCTSPLTLVVPKHLGSQGRQSDFLGPTFNEQCAPYTFLTLTRDSGSNIHGLTQVFLEAVFSLFLLTRVKTSIVFSPININIYMHLNLPHLHFQGASYLYIRGFTDFSHSFNGCLILDQKLISSVSFCSFTFILCFSYSNLVV